MNNRELSISATNSGREKDGTIQAEEVEKIEPRAVGTQPNIRTVSTSEPSPNFPSSKADDFKQMLTIADRISGKIARKLPPHISKEDIMAAGRLGLMDAYSKHEPSKGAFLPYAEKRIRGSIIDEMRKGDILPRRMRDKIKKEKKAGLRDDNGPQAQTLDSAHEAMTSPHADKGLYGGLVTPAVQEEAVINSEENEIVRTVVSTLEPRLRDIYHMYYVDGLTLEEIGQNLEITTSRVSQLRQKIETTIKNSLSKKKI